MKPTAKLLIIMSFLFTTTNSNAMPTVSDVISFPFKAVAKPFVWWRHGYENKVDEYKVEITYNLELDGKPLTVTKAINCEIYEGRGRSNRDGIKRQIRRVHQPIKQIIYKIEETGEVLILPVPGECKIDELDIDRTSTSDQPNTKKDFVTFGEKWVPTYAIIKFQKDDPKQIDRAEIAISQKLKDSPKSRVKIKSFTGKVETKENPISENVELLTIEKDSRFYFINGKGSSREKYRFGNYEKQDSGVYAAFGVIIFPQEIWSHIPKVKDFITKITKENPDQDFFYMAEKDEKWKGIKEVIEEVRNLTISSYAGIPNYVESEGVINDSLARKIAYNDGLLEKPKNDWKWVVKKGKEQEYQEILKKSNWRDYYYPFVYNHKQKYDEIYLEGKGLFILQKISNGEAWKADKSKSQEFHSAGTFMINGGTFIENDKTGRIVFYNPKTKELIFSGHGYGIFLK